VPSPVGHALFGLALHSLTARDPREAGSLARAGLIVGAALVPDLDLLFRFVDGRNHHQAESHSVGCAAIAFMLAWGWARVRGAPHAARWGVAAFVGWLSHVALDYFGRDTHPPIGLMALWPLSSGHFKFPWPPFMDIGRTLDWQTVRHNAIAVLWEIALLAPLAGACWRWRPSRRVP
jgi:membrane-bound metal-dependent hydrolase YbcI (DUF457 family)